MIRRTKYNKYTENNMSNIEYIERVCNDVYVVSVYDLDDGWITAKVFDGKRKAIEYCKSYYPREFKIEEFEVEWNEY